ncbi:hypothetical protein ACWGKS_06510 [Nocardiopsis sp. NPDC055879]
MTSGFPRATVFSAVLLLCLTGCANGAPETDEAPDAAPSAAASSSGDEEVALAAYTGMWDAVVAASHGDEEASRALDDHAVGSARELMRTALAEAAAGGETEGEPALDPTIDIEGPERAVVDDCVDDSAWGTGGTGGTAGPRRVDATLIHDGLAWRVSELRIWEAGSC